AGEASPLALSAAGTQAPASSPFAASATSTPSAAGAGMHDMIESIHATIDLAVRQGATEARIALQPDELGQISVRLSQTSQGLLARVSAETPAAAQALADGRAELHQSLSTLGVSLLRLDIGFGQSETGDRDGRFAGDPEPASASGAASTSEEVDGAETVGEPGAAAPASITGGSLVDVLA
ncbi:MAG: flagellar hook-length control protein FliK, partial [Solirubrobacterales bacterium]|nr:flagellar hook-length control protein FliK [Solirubrobacterales bacterium]